MPVDISPVSRKGFLFKERRCIASFNDVSITVRATKKPFSQGTYEVLVAFPIDSTTEDSAPQNAKNMTRLYDHYKATGSLKDVSDAIAHPRESFKSFTGEAPIDSFGSRMRQLKTDLESILRQVAHSLGERL